MPIFPRFLILQKIVILRERIWIVDHLTKAHSMCKDFEYNPSFIIKIDRLIILCGKTKIGNETRENIDELRTTRKIIAK